ncbi:BZIP transcription factor [Actinidia chinensis var. chinensis]|uniref:BZIP transcription factor n=1 Tax=Actinidia chinensis var. chinensis TaxID=1590841 RepID=A0A2R6R5V8_ACTCC|nr:BZIP transcription factor [Actinidia chinensis var. chinensis]
MKSMATPGGAFSGSTQIQISGLEERVVDQRKRKRTISNRESARRSRIRKQQHMDDLVAQASQLSEENEFILSRVNLTTQMFLNVEAENSVLRAQLAELTHRLSSLHEIIDCFSLNCGPYDGNDHKVGDFMTNGGDFLNPWNLIYLNQPIMY